MIEGKAKRLCVTPRFARGQGRVSVTPDGTLCAVGLLCFYDQVALDVDLTGQS